MAADKTRHRHPLGAQDIRAPTSLPLGKDRRESNEGKVVVILNPAADRGRAGGREPEVRKALDASRVKYELLRTERPGHASELSRAAVEAKASVVAAVQRIAKANRKAVDARWRDV